MNTWATVLEGDFAEPVRGDADEFRRAKEAWTSANGDAVELQTQFNHLATGSDQAAIEGQAAEALQGLVETARGFVNDDLPRVCSDLAGIMERHEDALRSIRVSTDRAYNRALLNWERLNAERDAVERARSRRSLIESQIQDLEATGEPDDHLRAQQSAEEQSVSTHESALEAALGQQVEDRKTWHGLVDLEGIQNGRTVSALKAVDFGSLGDPSAFEKAWGLYNAILLFPLNPVGAIRDALEVLGVDVDALLFEIRSALDAVLDVLALASLVVGAIALVATAFGAAPIAAAALAVFAVVAAVTAALSVAKLALDIGLHGEVDPATGKVVSTGDVIFSGISTALAVFGAKQAVGAAKVALKAEALGLRNVKAPSSSKPIKFITDRIPGTPWRSVEFGVDVVKEGGSRGLGWVAGGLGDTPSADQPVTKQLEDLLEGATNPAVTPHVMASTPAPAGTF